ncbi:MAG: PAS domain-containing protein [Proteobacteria bacterium]|nr:PAS domain-containing protein [Pseudomonadota bacterium]
MTPAAWRIFRVVIAVVLLVGLPTSLLLERSLSHDLIEQIEQRLLARARVADAVSQTVPATALPSLAKDLGTADARVTFIRADGEVVADSWVEDTDLGELDNHAERPEIVKALEGGKGIARRYSTTVGTDLIYVAVKRDFNGTPGVVRVATPLTELDTSIAHLRATLVTSGLLALALATLASWFAAAMVNRELEDLLREARTLAGPLELPDEADEDDEDDDRAEHSRESGEFPSDRPRARESERLEDELTQAVRGLAEQRDLVRAVLDGMSDGVVALDADGRVRVANEAAVGLFGWKKVPKGKRFGKRVPGALAEHVAALDGVPVQAELKLAHRQLIEVASAPLPRTGGRVLVLRDVTELRRLETVRRDFVGNVSHELGTPVAVIIANTETLLEGGALEDEIGRVRFTEAIDRQARRLGDLIADLLQITRIEAGELPLNIAPVRIEDAVLAVIESTGPNAQRHHVSVRSEDASGSVLADARALHSILENLVINAIKYGDGEVVIAADVGKDRTRIVVRDDGPGIPVEHRERVFERFYRVDKGRSREVGGTGLGLSIVRNLTAAMGGSVGVKRSAEGGAAFWVELNRPQA